MSGEEGSYLSYLLRLWQIRSGGEWVWRASLESPHTGECKGFANLKDLFIFLEQKIGHRAREKAAPNADEEGGDTNR